MKFLNNLDLNKNQLLNAVIQNLATAPQNPVKGLVYFNTAENKYYGWDGTQWVSLGSAGESTGDMLKSVYDTDYDGIVDKAEAVDDGTYSASAQNIKDAVDKRHPQVHALSGSDHTGDLSYSQIDDLVNTTGGGSTTKIPRADHTHTGSDGTDKVSYTNLTNIPSSFPPSAHASSHKGGGSDAIDPATTSVNGLMSASDKSKLDGIQAGAEVNQNAWSHIAVSGQTTVSATDKTDTLTLKNGTGITITTNAGSKEVTVTAHDHSNKDLLDSYTQTEASLADAVSKKHTQGTDTGTTSTTFQIGSGGPKIKNSSGEVQLRNAADSDYANLRVKDLYVEGTTTTISSNEVNIGDNVIKLNADITNHNQNSDGGIEVKRLQDNDVTEGNAAIYFDESSDVWKVTEGAPNNLYTFPVARKYVTTVGDGETLEFTVTHNMNSRDLTVTVRETGSPYAQVIPDIEFATLNAITVRFAIAPTTNQYTVVIVG